MASPNSAHIFGDFIEKRGIRIPALMHEYEASLTSAVAMKIVLSNRRSLSFLEEVGAHFTGPGDHALALAMHICNLPSAPCPAMTKECCQAEMSIAGGWLFHIHYVNWTDTSFTTMLTAIVEGETRPISQEDVPRFVGPTLEFGRSVGCVVGHLILLDSGAIEGAGHPNETYWRLLNESLVFTMPNGVPTTLFTTVVTHLE